MLLTITTTHRPATDLGFLLHKHPGRAQVFDVAAGTAHVFYPRADEDTCTAALLLEVDPVGLARGTAGGEGFALGQYVNDRPYAASSLLAVALGRVFRTAVAGRCDARPELVATPIPLAVHVPALPCRGGSGLAARLFGPLGWQVTAAAVPLDEQFPDWGDSPYLDLRLEGTLRLAEALSHLYVLLPVLDDAKHYWVGPDEVDKLVRAAAGWLAAHPERDLVTHRYLAHQRHLARTAVARLAEVDDTDPEAVDNAVAPPAVGGDAGGGDGAAGPSGDRAPDRPVPLAEQRRGAVLAVLRAAGARRVADLGCGEGALLAALLAEPAFTEVVGVDVSVTALERAARRLRLDRMPEARRARLRLFQSALTYRDTRLSGLDAAVLSEVVEHVDPPRLPALEHAVFAGMAPRTVVVTTPNAEYNVRFPTLPVGAFRHRDHRFEWTRGEFGEWAARVGAEHGYGVRFVPVGTADPQVGPPTQLAAFVRAGDGTVDGTGGTPGAAAGVDTADGVDGVDGRSGGPAATDGEAGR